MTFSKWWWTFMMAMHFLGLILIVGTVGLLDHPHHGIFEAASDRAVAPAPSLGLGGIRPSIS